MNVISKLYFYLRSICIIKLYIYTYIYIFAYSIHIFSRSIYILYTHIVYTRGIFFYIRRTHAILDMQSFKTKTYILFHNYI